MNGLRLIGLAVKASTWRARLASRSPDIDDQTDQVVRPPWHQFDVALGQIAFRAILGAPRRTRGSWTRRRALCRPRDPRWRHRSAISASRSVREKGRAIIENLLVGTSALQRQGHRRGLADSPGDGRQHLAQCRLRAPARPRDGVAMIAIGVPGNVRLPTSQSRAFLKVPGRPCAYSGTDTSRQTQAPTAFSRSATDGGGSFVSRIGIEFRPTAEIVVDNDIDRQLGRSELVARASAVSEDADRRLPEIARTRTIRSGHACAIETTRDRSA